MHKRAEIYHPKVNKIQHRCLINGALTLQSAHERCSFTSCQPHSTIAEVPLSFRENDAVIVRKLFSEKDLFLT